MLTFRRPLNVVVAAVGIVVTLPLMAAIALLVKITSPGPVLFVQARVGIDRRSRGHENGNHRRSVNQGGKLFKIFKFRTMAANGNGAQVWATPDDPRVTRVGRVLRLFRLDELPQLVNVLLGDMNVVGPRPEQPGIFVRLRGQIGSYAERQRVLPGITGWAQVNNSYDRSLSDVERKVALDLEYIERQSVFEDIKILLRTFPVVVGKRGAW